MKNLFDINMNYLKEKQFDIYKEVMSYLEQSKDGSVFELTSDKVLNIQCKTNNETFFLYSKYDPQYECERWLESYQIDKDTSSDFVIYGLGLTYHLAPIIQQFPNVKLFIYEPEVGVFIEALKAINVEELFTHRNIVNISIGASKLMLGTYVDYLHYYAKFPVRVLDIPIYRTINIKHFLAFLNLIEKVSTRKLFKSGFRYLFGDQMFKNSIRNISKMLKTPSIDILKDKFSDTTAIVVGGGPSLQYDIEYIKKIENDCLIIAAGSSVQSLIHYGIKPHIIVSMDPGIYNANIFTKNNFNDIPLLYMPQIHYQIVEVHSKLNVFGYYNNDIIINLYIDVEQKDYTFVPTYSVTGTAIQAAIYLGASTVLFAGQDLSYPGKQMYAPGASHINYKSNEKLDKDLTEEVDNVMGGKNPTTFSMKKTLEDIETILKMFPSVTFFNTSSKGAAIKGADFMTIEEAVVGNSGNKYDFGQIGTLIEQADMGDHPDFINVRNKTIEIVSALIDFQKTCSSVIRDIDRLLSISKMDAVKSEKLLRTIEKKWKVVIDHKVFKEIVEEWMAEELNEYDQKILDVFSETDIIKKSILLQDSLGIFCATLRGKLKEMQQEFEGILNSENQV